MNFKTLLTGFCLSFISVLHAQDCPRITSVVVEALQQSSGSLCYYDLEFSGNASSGQSIDVSISGADLMFNPITACLEGTNSPIIKVYVNCGTKLEDINITYRGSLENCSGTSSCHGTVQTYDAGITNSLPVELTDFRATQERFHQVQLEWVTASEENNALFLVEHSLDGRNFSELANIEGQGTTGVEHYYSYTDKFPESGINYYRLKQIDFDGTFSYSETISIEVEKNTAKPLVIANSLAHNDVTVIFNESPNANATLEVFNAGGVLFYQNKVDAEAAYLSLNISDFEPGVYFVRVPIGREYRIERFVKIGQ